MSIEDELVKRMNRRRFLVGLGLSAASLLLVRRATVQTRNGNSSGVITGTGASIPRHMELGDVLPNQHHSQIHSFPGSDHSGLSIVNPLYGDRLDYDGTNWVNAKPRLLVELVDEFLGGSNETGEVGELGWTTFGTGTLSQLGAIANHPGIYQIQVNNAGMGVRLGNNNIEMADLWDIVAIVSPTVSVANARIRIGMSPDHSLEGQTVAFFEYDPAVSANWRAVDVEDTDTGIAVVIGTWYVLRIRRVSATNTEYYVDDVLKATHTSSVTGPAEHGIWIQSQEVLNKRLSIDYWQALLSVTR